MLLIWLERVVRVTRRAGANPGVQDEVGRRLMVALSTLLDLPNYLLYSFVVYGKPNSRLVFV
jgi:hypothetical protein